MKKLGYLIINGIAYPMIEYKDGWVAVDEHSGEKGDWAIHKGEIVKVTDDNHMLSSYGYKKIIAQSSNLSLEGVMKVEIVTREREILNKFIDEIKKEFWNEDWTYLDFIADRVEAAQQRVFTEEQLEACWLAATRKTVEPLTQPGYSMFMNSLLPKYEVKMVDINRNSVDCIGEELGTGCTIRDGCNCKSSPVKLEPVTFEKNGETVTKAKLI